jgi:outer membrane biosynthesis protein TonB
LVALAVLVPRDWLFKHKPPVTLMNISLGGNAGPQTSGTTPMGGKPVEEVAPPPKRPEVSKPLADKPDTMTLPVKPVNKQPEPPKATDAPKLAVTPTPRSTGPQVTPGNSRVETGARGVGPGLTLSSGSGGQMTLTDFCCPGYITEMVTTIKSRWNERPPGTERGEVVIKYTIQRDGRVTDVEVEKGATFLLNNESMRPFLIPNRLQLKPLPAEYTERTLTIHLTFVYQ